MSRVGDKFILKYGGENMDYHKFSYFCQENINQ